MSAAPRDRPLLSPLAPFLSALASNKVIRTTLRDHERIRRVLASRGPWDRERLYQALLALLVRDPEQIPPFRRLFDQFFADDAKLVMPELDLERALAELRQLREIPPEPAPQPEPPPEPSRRTPAQQRPPPRRVWPYDVAALALFALVLATVFWITRPEIESQPPQDTTPVEPESPPETTRVRLYPAAPYVERIEPLEPLPHDDRWR